MYNETTSNTPAEKLLRLLLSEDKLPGDYTCYIESTEAFTIIYAETTPLRASIVAGEPYARVIARRCIPM